MPSLFTPRPRGAPRATLQRALNAELAAVRDAARGNATAARIRLAFWRDIVNACVLRSQLTGVMLGYGAAAPRRGAEFHFRANAAAQPHARVQGVRACQRERRCWRAPVGGAAAGRCAAAQPHASLAGPPHRGSGACRGVGACECAARSAATALLPWSHLRPHGVHVHRVVQDEDLDGMPPATVAALELYADRAVGSLLYLALEACGVRHGDADAAARCAAAAYRFASLGPQAA